MALKRAVVVVIAPFLLLAGCSAFFEVNLLKGLDKVSPPSASDYQGPGGLARLAADLSSPAIVEALKSDPNAVAGIVSMLQGIIAGGSIPDSQTAAILLGDIYLKTTSGDQVVNNAVEQALDPPTNPIIDQILKDIIPHDIAADPVKFADMINGLLAAKIAYAGLGAATPPGTSLPTGTNGGDLVEKATVAYLMDDAVSQTASAHSLTINATIDEMFKLVNNEPTIISGSPVNAPLRPPDPWLDNLYTAADVPLP
jgi:hypothetical protein